MDSIGFKIRKIREIKELSQDYVASKLGVSQNSYSKLERGEIKVDEDKLSIIAEILEVKTDCIKNYSDQIVFNNGANSEKVNQHTFQQTVEKLQETYETLLAEKDMRIKLLEEQLKSKKVKSKTVK